MSRGLGDVYKRQRTLSAAAALSASSSFISTSSVSAASIFCLASALGVIPRWIRRTSRRFLFITNSLKSYKSDRIQKNTVTFGACGRIRTGDLLITSELLCQLSHTSACASEGKSQAVLYHVLPCPSTINFVLRQGIRRVIMKPQVQKISSGETIPCCGKPV